MRVLIVSPWLPHARIAHGGGQHVFHTVRSLAERGHAVFVVCYGRQESASQVATLAAHCEGLHALEPAYTWRQKVGHVLSGGWRRPWMWGRRTHAEARALIHSICREQRIDVVHLAWAEMGCYLDAVPAGVATVLGTLDVEHRVRPREVRLYPWGWARMLAARRARRLIQGERRYVNQAHATLVCSAADRRHLARLVNENRIHVVAPWVDLGAMGDVKPKAVVTGRLTFVGALDRIANEAAVRFVVREVWPQVKRAHTGVVLHIVGASPPKWLGRQADGDARLVVTGYVAALVQEWAQTDVAVCPSLIGGGLVVKVAQAMAAGRPVVTTSLGNEGVGAPEGEAVAVANDAGSFGQAVLQLLSDRARWKRVAAAGRRHVVNTLDWGASMRDLEAAYVAAMEREKQGV